MEKEITITFKALVNEDGIDDIVKAVNHHIDWLINLDEWNEIIEIYNGQVEIED